MNIKDAKIEILNTIRAYTRKNAEGRYVMPAVRQRPILLIGPPGIGKTAIMEQIAKECSIGLVAYTITHHTRQSAVGLPVIVPKTYDEKEYSGVFCEMNDEAGTKVMTFSAVGSNQSIWAVKY